MSVAARPFFSKVDSAPWCQSPNSSFTFRNKEYRSATTALDEYINEFDEDPCYKKAWNSPDNGQILPGSLGCQADDVYDKMLKAIKSGSPDGKVSTPKLGEITIANVSLLPTTPSRQKEDDAETTITDLLTDCPGSRCLSRCSPVGHSSSGDSSGKKSRSPERSTTPSTIASHRSGSRPKARRSLNSPLNRSPSPYSKLHPDVPVSISRDAASPLYKLNLPSSPLKQAEDLTNPVIPVPRSTPLLIEDLTHDTFRRDLPATAKVPNWVNDLDISGVTSSVGDASKFGDPDSISSIGSERLKDLPKWLREMDTSDVTAVLNLLDKQLKDKSMSDSLSTISMSMLSEDGQKVSSHKAGFDRRTAIPGRKIFWDAADSPKKHQNRLLTLNEKDKIRQRLGKFDDHNSYRLKKHLELSQSRRSSASFSDDSQGRIGMSDTKSRKFVPRSQSVDRLSFASARSVSDITSDTEYLVSVKPPSGRVRISSTPSLNSLNQFASPRGHLGSRSLRSSSSSIGPRNERMAEFKLSKLLSPAVPRKPLERTRSMSAYDDFKQAASRSGRTSSPVKYKSMFLDDTSVHTSKKSPRSERAEKMIRDALAMPLLKRSPSHSHSNTTANTESLLNAKVTTPSFSSLNTSLSTSGKGDFLDHNQSEPKSPLSSNHPGSMEALKNILFTMQNFASSTADPVGVKTSMHDGKLKQDDTYSATTEAFTNGNPPESKTAFDDDVGGQVLQKAFMHLSKLKSLVSEDVSVTVAGTKESQ